MAHLKENAEMASNFTPMNRDELATFSNRVKSDLALFGPAPWEHAAYEDSSFNDLWV